MISQKLLPKIEDKSAKICVVGLGYVGIPLCRAFINAGFEVFGYDIDEAKARNLNNGISPIKSISDKLIAKWLEAKSFSAYGHGDRGIINSADVVIICVPTPLTESRDPDLSYVRKTAETVRANIKKDTLIVLESTTYPTTTRNVVIPILNGYGNDCGEDFLVCYSPEREDPGHHSAENIPKVVGGYDEESLLVGTALYSKIVPEVVQVSSLEIAEACKILENTYRAVNIALVNELKVLYDKMGIDVWEVIDAAKTKPFGFQAFYPGPGLGGHCLPIDAFYLSWLARTHGMDTRFIELAGEINRSMPAYVVSKTSEFLNEQKKSVNGSRILVVGIAYKKNIEDPRESPSFDIIERLLELGAIVEYHDQHIPVMPKMRHFDLPDMESVPLNAVLLIEYDAVIIATDHDEVDYELIGEYSELVVDTRDVMEPSENVRKA